MAGYGNRTAPNYTTEDTTNEHTSTRLGLTDSHWPYSNAHPKYGSGATGGAGFGNKSNSTTLSTSTSEDSRFGLHQDTAPYSGAGRVGSGSTAGAGYGNKTGRMSDQSGDSTMGRVVEKVGGVVHSKKVEEKGRVMREERNTAAGKEEGPWAN